MADKLTFCRICEPHCGPVAVDRPLADAAAEAA